MECYGFTRNFLIFIYVLLKGLCSYKLANLYKNLLLKVNRYLETHACSCRAALQIPLRDWPVFRPGMAAVGQRLSSQ